MPPGPGIGAPAIRHSNLAHIAGETEVWGSLLELLPPQPHNPTPIDGWTDGAGPGNIYVFEIVFKVTCVVAVKCQVYCDQTAAHTSALHALVAGAE